MRCHMIIVAVALAVALHGEQALGQGAGTEFSVGNESGIHLPTHLRGGMDVRITIHAAAAIVHE